MIDKLMKALARENPLKSFAAPRSASIRENTAILLRVAEAPAQPGGDALLLCDETGRPLPMQIAVRLDQDIEDATVTVTFRIDGNQVKFA